MPSTALALYTDQFLQRAPWFQRRVETVEFLDIHHVVRRTTLDIRVEEVCRHAETCPFFDGRPLVPLTMLAKHLFADFDLRDQRGGSLLVAPRDIDSFFAWSLLCHKAQEVLGHPASSGVETHLRGLCRDFPQPEDRPDAPIAELKTWVAPKGWKPEDPEGKEWEKLLANEQYESVLREFTFNFLLITQLDAHSLAPQLVKFAYQEYVPFYDMPLLERIGLREAVISIDVPAIGWVNSYHLQIDTASEFKLIDAILLQRRRPEQRSLPAETYLTQLSPSATRLYVTSTTKAAYRIGVFVRVPVSGSLRSLWLASAATTGVLVAGRCVLNSLVTATQHGADAVVALLLLGPSILTAYLVRPGEHPIASVLLRPIRYALVGAAVMSFIGASTLVLGVHKGTLAWIWTVLAVLTGVVSLGITRVVHLAHRDLNEVEKRERSLEERSMHVRVLPE